MDKYISGWKRQRSLTLCPYGMTVNRCVINFWKAILEKMNWENDVKLAIFFKFVWLNWKWGESNLAISMVLLPFNYKDNNSKIISLTP